MELSLLCVSEERGRMHPVFGVCVCVCVCWPTQACAITLSPCLQYPSCVAAYHITCAFTNGLKMESRVDRDHQCVVNEVGPGMSLSELHSYTSYYVTHVHVLMSETYM